MKNVGKVTLNNQNVKYIHDINNNKLWPPSDNPDYYLPLYFVATEDNTEIYIWHDGGAYPADLYYSFDNDTWTWFGMRVGQSKTNTVTINTGDKLYVKNRNNILGYVEIGEQAAYYQFRISKPVQCHGNIMSMVNYSNLRKRCFYNLFETQPIQTSPILPATTLAPYCYEEMFAGCYKLYSLPELPATVMKEGCYRGMFSNCDYLDIIPPNLLPAKTLATACYTEMFAGCEMLLMAPELPATTLATDCYASMFRNCISLTDAPELPALNLVTGCYSNMFSGCTELWYIYAMFTTNISSTTSYTDSWTKNVASGGMFVKNINATWNRGGTSGIPSGWRIEREAPRS